MWYSPQFSSLISQSVVDAAFQTAFVVLKYLSVKSVPVSFTAWELCPDVQRTIQANSGPVRSKLCYHLISWPERERFAVDTFELE